MNIFILKLNFIINKIVSYLYTHIENHLSLKQIANDMNINVGAINSIHQGLSYKDISKDYTFSVKNHFLPDDKVRAVCEALQRGDRLIDIINSTGVSKRSIYRIKNKEVYHDITKDYNY